MPYISMFFGIIIRMFYKEEEGPHFHAFYQGQKGQFDFNGNMLRGNIRSKTVLRLIKEWAGTHNNELNEDWILGREKKEFKKIEPLD